jgi:hypothetical protein
VVVSRRGSTRETDTEGGRVEVDDDGLEEEVGDGVLRVRDKVVVRSKAGVESAACSEAGDVAAVCSKARIEDGRWRRHDDV